MSARDLIQEALHSLEANKGRSLLTILGIVIGIASVIAMTSLIGGIQNSLVTAWGSMQPAWCRSIRPKNSLILTSRSFKNWCRR